MMIVLNPDRTDIITDQLVELWKQSVKVSHLFLTIEDIERLTPFVKIGISSIEMLAVKYDGNIPIAFIGIDGNKIEMLFVSADYFGNGIGKELIKYAIDNHNTQYVDVNEQNPAAVGFYEHLGFKTFQRNEFDDQGNPFPILKMIRQL